MEGMAKCAKNCAIKDVNGNIRMLDDDRLAILMDGNRYHSVIVRAGQKSMRRTGSIPFLKSAQ